MSRWLRIATTMLALAWTALAGASDCASLSVARWIVGDWVAGGEKSVFHESWTESGPQAFEGIGSELSMADSRPVNSEELRLVEMAGAVYYLAKVERNTMPVAFALTECSADRLVFENTGHDYPRRLEYRHESDGRMVVAASDGKNRDFTLQFERSAAAPDPGARVLAAEDARFAAMIGADVDELGCWLADDLQYVHSTGKVENRGQFLASIGGGTLRYLEIAPLEREVAMLGHDAAEVRGHGRMLAVAGAARFDMEIRYLAIYELGGDGRWRLRSWQSLRLPQVSG